MPRPSPLFALLMAAVLLPGCVFVPSEAESGPSEPPPGRSPYVGEERRAIKALSEEDVEALLAGSGHGYAKAAELNSYPGPAHTLELADALGLSDEQVARIEDVRARMTDDATRLGGMMVDAEVDLDRLFASGEADAERVSALTREIALLEGELRAVHLNAHLETRALLTRHQIVRYDELRGYGAEGGGAPHAHGGH